MSHREPAAPGPAGPPPDDSGHLLGYLARFDAACPVCGYNLRALAAPTCPECGAALRLSVGSPNLAIGPWALGAVAWTLALGFDGVVTILLSTAFTLSCINGAPPAEVWSMATVVSCFALFSCACGAGLWIMLARRKRWQRLPRPRQWRYAWTIFAGVGLFHALFGLAMFSFMN